MFNLLMSMIPFTLVNIKAGRQRQEKMGVEQCLIFRFCRTTKPDKVAVVELWPIFYHSHLESSTFYCSVVGLLLSCRTLCEF